MTTEDKHKAATQERLLTVAEAADIAAMKLNTMYALCQRQRIPSVKIGKMRRIKESDLAALIESNTVPAIPSSKD